MEEKNYKTIFIGDCSVGKTSICRSLMKKPMDQRYEATIGAAYSILSITQPEVDTKYTFHIWDTAGQERFHSLLPLYFRNAPICIIVFDVMDLESYNHITMWYKLYRNYSNLDSQILYLVGNKIDLRTETNGITREMGENQANEIGAFYDETSAIEDHTCHVFDNISTMLAGIPKYQYMKEEVRHVIEKNNNQCSC